jgi:hypothetical protein
MRPLFATQFAKHYRDELTARTHSEQTNRTNKQNPTQRTKQTNNQNQTKHTHKANYVLCSVYIEMRFKRRAFSFKCVSNCTVETPQRI